MPSASWVPSSPVRKHRAPKGALRRLHWRHVTRALSMGQKAPSAKRCIKTAGIVVRGPPAEAVRKHRAPKGALRLDTAVGEHIGITDVRKHRAPKGALRRTLLWNSAKRFTVRKHRAPKGALRLVDTLKTRLVLIGQKAPSAKRCIKTGC